MTFTPYLASAEYADFGISGASAADVSRACLAVDAYLGRSLLWAPDASGQPGYMANATPTASYQLTTPLVAGDAVNITITGARFPGKLVGSAVTIDRSNTNAVETCAVTAASGDTITLSHVQNNHTTGATLEFGLTLSEEAAIYSGFLARLRAFPLVRIFSISGGYGNRMSAADFLCTMGRPSALQGAWTALDLTTCDIDPGLGVCRLNTSAYSQARIEYLAGWNQQNIPYAIKQAVASVVANNAPLQSYEVSGDVKMLKAGDSTIQWDRGGMSYGALDSTAASLLAPYRSYRL